MGEIQRNVPGAYQGYPIESVLIELQIYHLLTVFCASQKLHQLAAIKDNDELDTMRQRFEESEACRLLISVAIMLRNLMDATSPEAIKLRMREQDAIVGTLQPDERETTSERLLFRDACNKIIHAYHINFDMDEEKPRKMNYINPTIYLYGEHHGSKWRATIDVVDFARCAYRLC